MSGDMADSADGPGSGDGGGEAEGSARGGGVGEPAGRSRRAREVWRRPGPEWAEGRTGGSGGEAGGRDRRRSLLRTMRTLSRR